MRTLAIRSENGKVTEEVVLEGNVFDNVKKIATKALEEWADSSDFYIMRDFHELRKKMPLDPKTYEALNKFLDRREGNEAVIKIPMYIISFENVWMENNFQDRRIYLIVPYLDEELRQELREMAIEATSEDQGMNEEESKSYNS